jgi:pimeloyl-ACP methyl ester carboxylesterase
MIGRPRLCGALLAATLATTGCGSARPRVERELVSVDGCVTLTPDARRIVIRPAGEAPLQAVLVGNGKTAAVLTNESDENLCSWRPLVAALTRRGYSVLLYDYRDPTRIPTEIAAGTVAARAAGAHRIVLMGASVGARGSIEAAARRPAGVVAVVSLSAERTVRSDPSDLVKRAHWVVVPTLLISARQDPFVDGATLALLRALASRRKQAMILPGPDHGTALLADHNGRRVLGAILSFIAVVG